MATASELSMNQNASASQMAQTIFGDGVTVVGANYSGSGYSSATYSGGDNTTPGVTPGDTGVILSTGRVSDFTNRSGFGNWWGDPNQRSNTSTDTGGQNFNSDFEAISDVRTYDASFLTVDFIPTGNVMSIKFVFASEEYPEYASSIYNDVVGVWSNGVHIPLSVTQSAASVVEINDTENINLYKDNTGDQFNTEMDGLTVTMTLTIPVNPGQINTLKLGIADASDSSFDSTLLIAGNSIQTTVIAIQDDVTTAAGSTANVDLLANDMNATGGTLSISHINGIAVSPGDTVTLPSGHQITLLADGTIDIVTTSDEEKISFTYDTVSTSSSGATLGSDVGFVTVDTVPCFVAGTLIQTPLGDMPVETLVPGDLVDTLDDGAQPLRWIGTRTVAAQGCLAPISFARNALGQHGSLLLSPQHRVLLRDALSSLLFGEDEVLVAAKDLVNDSTIRPCPGGSVTYVHLMFDRHQVIWAEGLPTESFLPGPQMKKAFARDALDEITTLFPQINWTSGQGYGPAARRTLRHFEARVLSEANL
ncbi:Hint domain-containing protein [Loktanella sp. SALINAS62]|uniref:Hint domain-containing protein n=1 Tax=Loktanella sp. SALINAS62 TaxID=2706124 RepID=UPI001B8DA13C|nr:Hint domain-containing protein [Loktanella sp. SALINAS62]MBS1301841.1 Hint domain-containing protein [Loktanella sp. SALINAS62]